MNSEISRNANLYTVSSGQGLLSVLADHLLCETTFGNISQSGELNFSDITLLLPTKRAIGAMRDIFLARSEGKACILPQMRALGDVDESEHGFEMFTGLSDENFLLPPTIPPLQRQFLLARHVMDIYPDIFNKHSDSLSPRISPASALLIARDLLSLLDSAEIEQAQLSGISSLVADHFAENWQQTVAFLELITKLYPEDLLQRGQMEPMAKRNKLILLYAHQLKVSGKNKRIIAAGSTGSTPATRELLKIIAMLPSGGVILPGLDKHLDEETWQKVGEDHPQYAMKNLLEEMAVNRSDVKLLSSKNTHISDRRERLMSEVMRPAALTDKWARTLQDFSQADIEQALSGVSLITAPSLREEALVIALKLRSVLETPGKTAALVTPDRSLARRVLSEMKRWGVEMNDSAGRQLSSSPKAKCLLLITECLRENFSPVSLLSLLKHPCIKLGMTAQDLNHATYMLERNHLRGPKLADGLAVLKKTIETGKNETKRKIIMDLIAKIESAFAPFESFKSNVSYSLKELSIALLQTYQTFYQEEEQKSDETLWGGEDGEILARIFHDIFDAAELAPDISIFDLKDYLQALLDEKVLHHNLFGHPRLYVFGLLEARLISCDMMILGGLNEGVWPQTPGSDPWLNRPMRAELGLGSPERRIGLSAHDFVQNFCSPEVVVTRSEKVDGDPTVPSRWLLRLKAVLEALETKPLISYGEEWLSWAGMMDEASEVTPALPPRPMPPVASRPRELSVTQIETWQRDPYAIYARHILGLKPLPEIDADPGYADKGTLIHKIMERYTNEMVSAGPSVEQLIQIGAEEFEKWRDLPSVTAFWQPRFERIAHWFVPEDKILSAGVKKHLAEVSGRVRIETEGDNFELRGIADRIDFLPDGSLRILDYKTGTVPGPKEVHAFASQMPLLAYMAMAGGYKDVPKARVSEILYVKLTGGQDPGEIKPAGEQTRGSADNINKLVDQTLAGLIKRITQFDREDTPYLTRIQPKNEDVELDYDHLSRYREWAVLQSWEARSK